jgi:hypothetical protein
MTGRRFQLCPAVCAVALPNYPRLASSGRIKIGLTQLTAFTLTLSHKG